MFHKMKRALYNYCRRQTLIGKHNNLQKTHLLVACMPKSGSTYLSAILSSLEGFQPSILVHSGGRREQELDVLQLVHYDDINYVAQLHVRYSQETQELMERFDIKPIVLVRNIYDVAVSFRDHFRNESTVNPMGYAFPYMKDWPDEKLEEFIVDICMPWYFNFFMSWQESDKLCLLTYEELVANPKSSVGKLNKHFSLGLNDEDINRAIELAGSKFTRKNIGKTGRGEHLNDYCKLRIERLAGYYVDTDFSLLGLHR